MRDHQRCPECDSPDVEVVHTEWYTDYVERVKICNECPTQFTVSYANPYIVEVNVDE